MGRLKAESGDKTKGTGKGYQPVRAPRGPQINCQAWPQEAALRLLMNSLDEDVAERPRELIACGATGRVLHDWNSYGETVKILKHLKNAETLIIQSGNPTGVFETGANAPRVLILNTHPPDLPPAFRIQSGQMQHQAFSCRAIAGSWTYVGAQEALAATFYTLDAICQRHFGENLGGKLIVSGGMGPAGGTLSLAAGMHGAAFLGIDVDEERIKRRIRAGYCDYCVNALDEALRILKNAVRQKQAVSVGLVGNCADIIPELASRGVVPDILTDMTSAHDLLAGYLPSGLSSDEACALRCNSPEEYLSKARGSIARHFEGMLALQRLGSIVFEFGNGICAAARKCAGVKDARAFPDFIDAYLQPLLSEGLVPVRWVALSGEAGDIRLLDDLGLKLFPDDTRLTRWISLARQFVRIQGLPARVYWMGAAARTALAGQLNNLVAEGSIKAPVVIALDGSASNSAAGIGAAPQKAKETSRAAIDQTTLETILKAASGTSWVSIDCGADYATATAAMVADGTPATMDSLPRALKGNFIDGILQQAVGLCQEDGETPHHSQSFKS